MTFILELLAKLFLPIFDWYLKKTAHDEQAKKDYIAFLEIMHRKGMTSVQKRLKSVEQIERIKEKWRLEEETEK